MRFLKTKLAAGGVLGFFTSVGAYVVYRIIDAVFEIALRILHD